MHVAFTEVSDLFQVSKNSVSDGGRIMESADFLWRQCSWTWCETSRTHPTLSKESHRDGSAYWLWTSDIRLFQGHNHTWEMGMVEASGVYVLCFLACCWWSEKPSCRKSGSFLICAPQAVVLYGAKRRDGLCHLLLWTIGSALSCGP